MVKTVAFARISLPPVAPDERQPGVKSAKAMDDFLLELIPYTKRGKELVRGVTYVGLAGRSFITYENVTINEMLEGELRTRVIVTFPKENCSDRPDQ
jgi:hypothetical protein